MAVASRDEMQRVHQQECAGLGHSWSVVQALGVGPTRTVCSHCGESHSVDPVPSIDYADLLRRYVDHVGQCEGSDFMHLLNTNVSGVQFTLDEVAVLLAIADTVGP